jgi:hypothetical protein
MDKRRVVHQVDILISNHWKPKNEGKNDLWIENDIGKVFSMITILFLKTLQLELVCKSYELAKLQYSYIGKIKNFQYSLLKVLGLFVTLMHPHQIITKYIIRSKVMTSSQV